MLEHPLQLRGTRLISLAFRPSEGFKKDGVGWTMNAEVGYVYDHKHADRWGVRLSLHVGPDDQGREPPYEIDAQMAGEYQWTGPNPPHGELHRLATLVVQNGATMLYGMLREILVLLTGRSVHGVFSLPAVSFSDYEADPMRFPKNDEAPSDKRPRGPGPKKGQKKARRS